MHDMPSTRTGQSEESLLLERLRLGDETVFAELVDAWHGSLHRVATSYLEDAAAAEEVVQETWLAVIDGLDRFQGRSSLKTWVFSILMNKARTRARRDARMVVWSAFDEQPIEASADPHDGRFKKKGSWQHPPLKWTITPEDTLLRDDLAMVIKRTIEELPANQRVVVTMRDLQGLDPEDVCQALGITNANHRVLLHRARAAIRAAIERYMVDGEEEKTA